MLNINNFNRELEGHVLQHCNLLYRVECTLRVSLPDDLTSEVSHATLKRTRKKGHIRRNINTGDGQGQGCHSDFARKIIRKRDP